jgi:hypothetical protein
LKSAHTSVSYRHRVHHRAIPLTTAPQQDNSTEKRTEKRREISE